jgi:hypothetical protein
LADLFVDLSIDLYDEALAKVKVLMKMDLSAEASA